MLGRIGDKWSLYVIHLLGDGTRRFSELRRQIDGITPRMLTVTIRSLERDGLISRTVYPVVPPRVEYALTPLGESLLQAATTLLLWADVHQADLMTARDRYDEANRGRAQAQGHGHHNPVPQKRSTPESSADDPAPTGPIAGRYGLNPTAYPGRRSPQPVAHPPATTAHALGGKSEVPALSSSAQVIGNQAWPINGHPARRPGLLSVGAGRSR